MKQDVISLFPYVGGKSVLALKLVEMIYETYERFPEIDTFIEGAGGGGRVILNLPRYGRQIYSEYDPCLSNLFWVVSDSNRVCQLIDLLEKDDRFTNVRDANYGTLYENYKKWASYTEPISDPIECAAYAYYMTNLSRNGRIGEKGGFYPLDVAGMFVRNEEENLRIEDDYWKSINKLPSFPEILQGVEFYYGSCTWFLKYCKAGNFLIYLDPPYLKDTFITPEVMKNTGLVTRSYYEYIKGLLDKGENPVYVNKKRFDLIKELKQQGDTPVTSGSQHNIGLVRTLVRNKTEHMPINANNTIETPAIFNYATVVERFGLKETMVKDTAKGAYVLCYDANLRNDYVSGVNVRLHMDIVTLARESSAKIMISGYDNSIYDYLLEPPTKWRKINMGEQAVVSSGKDIKEMETEYIWLNF